MRTLEPLPRLPRSALVTRSGPSALTCGAMQMGEMGETCVYAGKGVFLCALVTRRGPSALTCGGEQGGEEACFYAHHDRPWVDPLATTDHCPLATTDHWLSISQLLSQ